MTQNVNYSTKCEQSHDAFFILLNYDYPIWNGKIFAERISLYLSSWSLHIQSSTCAWVLSQLSLMIHRAG